MKRYEIIGSTQIMQYAENGSEEVLRSYDAITFSKLAMEKIGDFMASDLAEGISKESSIYGVVTGIFVTLAIRRRKIVTEATVTCDKELSLKQLQDLTDFIKGQFTGDFGKHIMELDFGWGFVKDDGTYYTRNFTLSKKDTEVYLSIKLWDDEKMNITITELE